MRCRNDEKWTKLAGKEASRRKKGHWVGVRCEEMEQRGRNVCTTYSLIAWINIGQEEGAE
jgi:hypothetical protein